MSSPPPGSPPPSAILGGLDASLVVPRHRIDSPAASLSNLPYRSSNQSLSDLFASTSSLPRTVSGSSSGAATPTLPNTGTFSPSGTNRTRSPARATLPSEASGLRDLIVRSFAPNVGVLASPATDALIQEKGIPGGFLQLVRPFGEQVQGKVIIRNSVGASQTWEDFGIRFTGLKDGLSPPRPPPAPRRSGDIRRSGDSVEKGINGSRASGEELFPAWTRVGGDVNQVEEVVDRHLNYAETRPPTQNDDYFSHSDNVAEQSPSPDAPSPFYALYLQRMLSALPMTPHETFSHPVACIIAISSHDPSPIEDLRRLYDATNRGDYRLPQWVNNEFLRYYVLVHDEDRDEIKTSTALYEQMKRHFGLHCHLLRIRSNQCLPSDDESLRLPTTSWISAAEELAQIRRRESSEDDMDPTPYIFDTDAVSLRTLVRELTVQSIIPSMERSLSSWSESVLSRRRGLSGRFMSLSKRWTPFGSGSSSRSSSGGGGPLAGLQSSGGSSGNYDSLQGFYRPESPEALLRKLADYAVMLRDWKLASSTYDLLRSDFASDKAWRYYAGACEMCVVATLLDVLARGQAAVVASSGGKARLEGVDGLLEAASYSYVTRCIAPFYALRALALGSELLRMRGYTVSSSSGDDSARWLCRVLESGLVANVGAPLVMERVSAAYASKPGLGRLRWGTRRRKAAFWAVMATEAWLRLGKALQASRMLERVDELFGPGDSPTGTTASGQQGGDKRPDNIASRRLEFEQMRAFIDALRQAIIARRQESRRAQDYDEQALAEGSATNSPSAAARSAAASQPPLDPDDPLGAAMLDASERVALGDTSVAAGDVVTTSEKLDVPAHHRRGKSLSVGVAALGAGGGGVPAPHMDPLSPLSPSRRKGLEEERGSGVVDDNFE